MCENITKKTKCQELEKIISKLKGNILPSSEMYKKIGLDEERAFNVLRSEGFRGTFAHEDNQWSDNNPTSGYCYRITGAVFVRLVDEKKCFSKEDMIVMRLKKVIGGIEYNHYFFIVYIQNVPWLIDLTRDQIGKDNVHNIIEDYPYERAKVATDARMKRITQHIDQTKFRELFWERYDQLTD